MRSSLRWCAATAAVAALAGLASLPGLSAATPASAAPSPIKHVVVIYQENHTFDNVLGFWCDIHRARCPDGGMPRQVTLSNGVTVTPTVDPDIIPNVTHTGEAQVLAMNNGKMNGWENIPKQNSQIGCSAKWSYICVSGYKPSQIPNTVTLANKFAISDDTFSLSDSPSWEGHIYAVAASTDGFWGDTPQPPKGAPRKSGWGCQSDRVADWMAPDGKLIKEPSCVPDFKLGLPNGGAFEHTRVKYVPTIMDRLDAAGLSWKIYGAVHGQGAYGLWDICPSFAECLYTSQDDGLVPNSQFATDAADGDLPNFSVVTPGGDGTFLESCHNLESMTACDNYIGELVSEVENGPDWKSTAIFITYDDFGGFYDQVYPGTNSNPDGTQQGPRVPLIIVSPYVKAHYTDTTHTTFAGILAYVEHLYGLKPLDVNDEHAYDFHNAFDYSQKPLPPVHMVKRRLSWAARHIKLTPALVDDPS